MLPSSISCVLHRIRGIFVFPPAMVEAGEKRPLWLAVSGIAFTRAHRICAELAHWRSKVGIRLFRGVRSEAELFRTPE